LFFKNFVKRNWTDEDGNYKLPQQEVASIKSELIGLMVSVPSSIQSQLGEAISAIADSDFWQRWDTLVDDLVSRLTPDDHVVNAGVLQVANSIFSRWRPLFRSDELFTEVNHVLSKFATPYMSLLQNLDASIEKDKSNKVALLQEFAELDLAVQLFYDLSCQDLPPQFEEAISPLADLLLKYLRFDSDLLRTTDENEAGPLENVKAGIFEGLTLYVQKYYDAFGPYVKRFVENSWELLTTIGLEPKYDVLVSKALHFLTSTTSNAEQAKPFNDNDVLAQVVEKVILPNLSLRDSDIEMFEDEPIEFIRRDLEGSDSETRRRAATDFLRKLMEQFETPVTSVVSTYVKQFLAAYSKDPKANWRSKDTAVYLFCSIAAKGTPTAAKGVTQTNVLVDVGEFFSNNLAGDLTDSDIEPLLKVDAIKYLYLFRSIITKDQWQQAMPLLVNRLGDSNYVVYTYAAIAVERVLYLADENGKPLIDPADIRPLSKDLLEHLFSLIEKGVAPEKIQENEFLMRCVMRVLIVIKEGVLPITDSVVQHLVKITIIIYHNPSNPRFYYYHFESAGALIRLVSLAKCDGGTDSASGSRVYRSL
jgi:exportin-2 (importin alpha re-exporter)